MQYKIGDKVRIVSERTWDMNSSGYMDHHLGTIMTIASIRSHSGLPYDMVEDNNQWAWGDSMIQGYALQIRKRKTK